MATTTVALTSSEAREAAQAYLNERLAQGAGLEASQESLVPVIDIAPSFSSSLEDRKAVARQIHDACVASGFFHITGHNIAEETRQRILGLAKRYLRDQPQDKKEALHVKHSQYFRGYEPAAYTQTNPGDWSVEDAPRETKQAFNWAYEAGLDPTGGDGLYRELDGEAVNGNVWPSGDDIPGFYETVKEYYSQVLNLARHLFRLFALSLDLPEDYFDPMTTHPGGIGRLLYYPASPELSDQEQKGQQVGLGAHTDYECFTILLCSSVSGLEILSPHNAWIPAPAAPGGFLINVADFLMRWTNGRYKSTVHRVTPTREERFSVPFFFSVNYDQLVETLPSCVSAENPSRFPPVRAGEYVLERLRATAKDG